MTRLVRTRTPIGAEACAAAASLACVLLAATGPTAVHADVYDTLYAHMQAPSRHLVPKARPRAKQRQANLHGPVQLPTPRALPEESGTYTAQETLAHDPALDVPFIEHILLASRMHRVPAALIHAVIAVESGFNPNARSSVGAVGLMQLMPATAAALGVQNPTDPQQNILGGTLYLRRLLYRFAGNLRHALCAYNAGPAAVLRYDGVPPYPDVKRYVRRVLSRYHRLRPRYALAASTR